MDFKTVICGRTLEYFDLEHVYLVDGMCVPSITQLLNVRFGNRFDGIDKAILRAAAAAGTAVHEAIERYCRFEEESELQELRNFKFLQRQYRFTVLANEVPVILHIEDKPIAAGRLDMVIGMNGKIGGADIKRTATLDKEYLAYQLNLYRIAYKQCYGETWEFLRGIHLKDDTRRFVQIPINEQMAYKLIDEWRARNETV